MPPSTRHIALCTKFEVSKNRDRIRATPHLVGRGSVSSRKTLPPLPSYGRAGNALIESALRSNSWAQKHDAGYAWVIDTVKTVVATIPVVSPNPLLGIAFSPDSTRA